MRLFQGAAYAKTLAVSIHASVKDATCLFLECLFALFGFNPRICKRCDCIQTSLYLQRKGFNPRICKRCDSDLIDVPDGSFVSIHASVKDATSSGHNHFYQTKVSIHASVKDATLIMFRNIFIVLFQSTHL